MKHRPDSPFGTVNGDVRAFKEPTFRRTAGAAGDEQPRHDKVNAPVHERLRAFARRIDDRLLMHIEARVDEHRSARLAIEG
jgi:hypothetical protein